MKKCSKCSALHDRNGRYCKACHAAYMRKWRKTHRLSGGAREKANTRSYARTYLRRGKIEKFPCSTCGGPKSEMHHPDYAKPTGIVWMCRKHHLALHKAVSTVGPIYGDGVEIHRSAVVAA